MSNRACQHSLSLHTKLCECCLKRHKSFLVYDHSKFVKFFLLRSVHVDLYINGICPMNCTIIIIITCDLDNVTVLLCQYFVPPLNTDGILLFIVRNVFK